MLKFQAAEYMHSIPPGLIDCQSPLPHDCLRINFEFYSVLAPLDRLSTSDPQNRVVGCPPGFPRAPWPCRRDLYDQRSRHVIIDITYSVVFCCKMYFYEKAIAQQNS